MSIEDYKEDKFIKTWLNGLAQRTQNNYIVIYKEWLTFINLSPTEQISKRMQNLASTDITERLFFEQKWKEFKAFYENKGTLKHETVRDKLKVVASFFSRNGLPLALKHGDWESTQTQEVIKLGMQLKLEDIKNLYAHANLNERIILLCLVQSGFSETDALKLKIEDIPNLSNLAINEHAFIMKPREKTNIIQATCLSCEFIHDLKNLLAEKGNPTQGYIFVSQTKGKDENKPLTERRVNECMKALFEKTFGSEKAKEFKTKMFRSFYNSALLRAKISPQEIKDVMMGHKREGARGHYSYDDETIKEAYNTAFPYLTINGMQAKADILQLKEDFYKIIGEQKTTIETLKEEHTKEINEMKEALKLYSSQYDKLEAMFNTLNISKPKFEESKEENKEDSKTNNEENNKTDQ